MSAQAFIAFLRVEAIQAEERARHLRATAAAIEANSAHDDGSRKKRKRDPGKPKRQQTAYTCFVSENYELIKKNHDPNMPSKDVIALIARQWAATSEEEKVLWKERANVQNTARHEHEGLAEGVAQFVDAAADEGDKGKKKRAATAKKVKVSAAV